MAVGKQPSKDELMHVYVNHDAEQPTQLTPEALRCCQSLQIDFRELLPFSKDSLKNKASTGDVSFHLDLVMR